MPKVNPDGVTKRFEALFADPTAHPGNRDERKLFRRWCGDRFDEWYQRGHAIAAERGEDKLWLFEEDWYPDGVEAYRRMKRGEATMNAMDEIRALTRLETVRELLEAVSALGGDASPAVRSLLEEWVREAEVVVDARNPEV